MTEAKNKFKKFEVSSDKVSRMIGFGKTHGNREGLGYEGTSTEVAHFMKENTPASVEKMNELRLPKSAFKSVLEQGLITQYQSPQVTKDAKLNVYQSRCVFKSKLFTPTCHYCGKLGHIRPRCYLLHRKMKKQKQGLEFNPAENLQTELKNHLVQITRIAKMVAIPEGLKTKNKQTWVKKDQTNVFHLCTMILMHLRILKIKLVC